MIQYYKNMDSETKEILFETIKIFIKSAKDTVQNSVQEKIQEYQGTLHLNPWHTFILVLKHCRTKINKLQNNCIFFKKYVDNKDKRC